MEGVFYNQNMTMRLLLACLTLAVFALASCPADYTLPDLVADSRELTVVNQSQHFSYPLT